MYCHICSLVPCHRELEVMIQMNLMESVVAVFIMGVLLSVFCAVDAFALTRLQTAAARQTALMIAQGTVETDARLLAIGRLPAQEASKQDQGVVYSITSRFSEIVPGLRDVQVTVTYVLFGHVESLGLYTREITSL